MFKFGAAIALLFVLGTTSIVPAVAASGHSVATLSPLGFKIFCLRNPEQCVASSPQSIDMTDATMGKLKQVNLQVNRSIRPVNDAKGRDVWTLNPSSGDCEDFVVTKRARLIKMGFPPGALRIARGTTRSGEGHAVLLVRTSKGDMILDSLTNTIKPKSQSNLRFIAMSGPDPKAWAAL